MRKTVVVLAMALMGAGSAVADTISNPASSFNKAKEIARDTIYANRKVTFYCSCTYTNTSTRSGGKIDVAGCGYVIKANEVRGKRLEWEHVMPAARIGQHRNCWQHRELFPKCFKSNGKLHTGRDCCLKVDAGFKLAHNDLHNLVPSVGEINGDRSNHPYGIVEDEPRDYGTCDFEIGEAPKVAEPATSVRGDAARIWLYMSEMHGVALSPEERGLMKIWSGADPPDTLEIERDSRIKQAQGNSNPFVP